MMLKMSDNFFVFHYIYLQNIAFVLQMGFPTTTTAQCFVTPVNLVGFWKKKNKGGVQVHPIKFFIQHFLAAMGQQMFLLGSFIALADKDLILINNNT